jgi:hypothetical protein
MDPIYVEALKVGTFADSAGVEHTFTEGDLARIAASYNPAVNEAPVVIGHPDTNAPAFGWVKDAVVKGKSMYLGLKDLVPEFVDACKKGMYKKRSIALRPDLSIRHIGFLGGTPPAIKGLVDFAFAEGKSQTFVFDGTDFVNFAEGGDPAKAAQQARSKKYKIAVHDGGNVSKPSQYASLDDSEFADPVNYAYPIDETHIHAALSYWGKPDDRSKYSKENQSLITKRILRAAKDHGVEVSANFNEGGDVDLQQALAKITTLEQEIKDLNSKHSTFSESAKTEKTRLESELATAKKALADGQAAGRKAEHLSFCEKLIGEGRLNPKSKDTVMGQLELAYQASTGSFAEGQKKPIDELKTMLESQPVVVEFAELAQKSKVVQGNTEEDQVGAITGKAAKYRKEQHDLGNAISFSEAVAHVTKKS